MTTTNLQISLAIQGVLEFRNLKKWVFSHRISVNFETNIAFRALAYHMNIRNFEEWIFKKTQNH